MQWYSQDFKIGRGGQIFVCVHKYYNSIVSKFFQSVVAPVFLVLLPRLLWPLTIYAIGLLVVEKLERKVNRYTRKWLGLPPALSSIALYSRSTSLRLPLRSIMEEYKLSKIRMQWMLKNSAWTAGSAKSSHYSDLKGNSERRMRSTDQ